MKYTCLQVQRSKTPDSESTCKLVKYKGRRQPGFFHLLYHNMLRSGTYCLQPAHLCHGSKDPKVKPGMSNSEENLEQRCASRVPQTNTLLGCAERVSDRHVTLPYCCTA